MRLLKDPGSIPGTSTTRFAMSKVEWLARGKPPSRVTPSVVEGPQISTRHE